MNAAMRPQPTLSPEEWSLVIELLERERKELPAEIRHTRTPAVHDSLRGRLEMIGQLLERLRPANGS